MVREVINGGEVVAQAKSSERKPSRGRASKGA
jgi:hypothetical protein